MPPPKGCAELSGGMRKADNVSAILTAHALAAWAGRSPAGIQVSLQVGSRSSLAPQEPDRGFSAPSSQRRPARGVQDCAPNLRGHPTLASTPHTRPSGPPFTSSGPDQGRIWFGSGRGLAPAKRTFAGHAECRHSGAALESAHGAGLPSADPSDDSPDSGPRQGRFRVELRHCDGFG